ncbi:unnamed protein product [Rodentolepis nana]|uniref:Secreted protein n=1 Tax=Rodentolepis nana TaxID=102285 RepID=A0A0R3TXH7_RODNA|nr:unnamed protein product [Rodentolepis nana]
MLASVLWLSELDQIALLMGAEELIHGNVQWLLIQDQGLFFDREHIVVLPVTRSMARTYCGASCNQAHCINHIVVLPVTRSIASMGPSCNYEWEHIVVLPVTRSMAGTYCGASCN